MGLLKNIMKKKTSFVQSDNKGTYHNSVDIASVYWAERKKLKKFEPFLLYKFNDETDAVRALMQIECIKIAEDTEELICTEPLIFGYYPVEKGSYEVIFCGESLNNSLFDKVKAVFETNNGEVINEKKTEEKKKEPVPVVKNETEKPMPAAEFVSDELKEKNGKDTKIRIFRAINSKDAIAFLETKLVTKKDMVIIVKTPEGIYGRNYNGIYKVSANKKKS